MKIRIENIGAASGVHDLGTIDGPGLYKLCGDNATGKTTLMALLDEIGRSAAKAGKKVLISHGSTEAGLEIGDAVYRFSYSAVKGAVEVFHDGDPLPVTPLPEEILRLLDPQIKGDEERLRARVDALIRICRIGLSDAVLDALIACLPPLAIEADRPAERGVIVAKMVAGKVPNPGIFLASADPWRVAAKAKPGLLDGADELRKLSQALARGLEALAEQKEGELKPLGERFKKAKADLADLQTRRGTEPLPAGNLGDFAHAVASAEASLAARRGEESRRARMLEAMGPARPGDLLDDGLEGAVRKLGRTMMAKAGTLEAASSKHEASFRELAIAKAVLHAAILERIRDLYSMDATLGESNLIDLGQLFETQASKAIGQPEPLATSYNCVQSWLRATRQSAEDLAISQQAHAKAVADHRDAYGKLESWKLGVIRRREEQARWDTLQDQLNEPIEGATEEDVARRRHELGLAQLDVNIGIAEMLLRETERSHEDLRRDVVNLTAQIKRWRDVGTLLWRAVGKLVGEELKVPWIRVEDMRILLACRGTGEDSRLALGGQAEEWRDIDVIGRMSTGELSEAFLHLFLTRSAELAKGSLLPPIVTIPWHVLSSIVNPERLAGLDTTFKEAGVVGIGEVPTPGKLRIEKV